MIRGERNVKRILLTSIFLISILLANSLIFEVFNYSGSNNFQTNLLSDNKTPLSSDSYLSDYYITGSGNQQDVRIYGENTSSSLNNQGSFEIPSMSAADTSYLSYGNFNFTFQNNYTTDYIIENTNALDTSDFIKFNYNTGASTINAKIGTILDTPPPPDLSKLVDNNPATYIRFLSNINGLLSFNISSSFASTSFSPLSLNFNRNFILGLISTYQFSITKSAYLTLRVFDSSNSAWINITNPMFFNSSISTHNLEKKLINQNLKYINSSNICNIQFFFTGLQSSQFTLTLREYHLTATYAFDLPITNTSYVALEFDLKGESSTINGFYAWIRTLNLTGAQNTELYVTLYQANSTIQRTETNLALVNLRPDISKKIDSFIIKYNDYHNDSLTYFSFNISNTQKSPLYNYFIVINSNQSKSYHSLVSIPRASYGDPDIRIDHQLRTTLNNGTSWNVARKTVTGAYTSGQLDAASFKLNVTRGYMPSDFINPYNNSDTLRIQNLPIKNRIISIAPYAQSSSLTWGLGQWIYNFTTPITSIPPNNFEIALNWNNTYIKGFYFNISYIAKAYWIENANSYYNVSYDNTPRWQLNFTLDLNDPNLDNWEFQELWVIYPNDYSATNLTNPNYVDIYDYVYNATGSENKLPGNPVYEYTNVSKEIINGLSGFYSLSLTSTNLIHQMHSYINYNNKLWETNGFMYGDNISVRVDIQNPNGDPAIGGNANVVLFYPNNETKYPGAELSTSLSEIKESSLVFEFNNQSILDVTEDVELLGNYYLAFFWENGSAVGCKKLKLYIDDYDVKLNSCFYEPLLDKNVLDGIVDKVYNNYSILIGTVNVTSGAYDPDFYAVNNSGINQEYIYEINGEKIPIQINSFLQNETVLNPDEDVKINLEIQNLHPFVDINVKVKVQLVSLLNDQWIIDEQTSDLKVIKPSVDPNGNHIQEFSTILQIPTLQSDGIWKGLNAPVRKGGVKTRAIIYFEHSGQSFEVGTFVNDGYSLLVNSSQNDFDGYILALKYDTTITGASLLKPFSRNECQYLPEQTTFVVNIYDKNYISSYGEFISSFSLKLNSNFSNIISSPTTPIYGQSFNLSSDLTTEFGISIPSENVTLQLYNENKWNNISNQISNENGTINFEIDTLSLLSEDEYLFRLIWNGNEFINSKAQNITVTQFKALNEITISIQSNVEQIFKVKKSPIKVILINSGDSELIVNNISVLTNPNSEYIIAEINYLDLQRFAPEDITELVIEIDVPAIEQITLTISIESLNPITNEINIFEQSATFEVYDLPLETYLLQFFILIMVGIFLLAWAIMLIYRKRIIRKIETPIEIPLKRRPRRGKYVSVSELPKKGPPKEELEQKEEEESEEEQKTDLDSLLEEEGL
ncbi:MAG: hypothetical protein EAX89_07065 [Candidatus Lokiarchaeota archaeon]|nr:hypothetical protein [Candidatus Lokiarchaeota archaeon]